jgi:5-formyltetrahydrofolate cyclo-ligase
MYGKEDSVESPQIAEAWQRVQSQLIRHAIPDARFHLDFPKFIPDFRGSASALDLLVSLKDYLVARTILVSPDNSLEGLRYRALQDGKNLLVATHGMQRGFVLLDPRRIPEEKYEQASWLDGMERAGIGRHISLAQMTEENIKVDFAVTGCFMATSKGVPIGDDVSLFRLQWYILRDRGVIDNKVAVAVVAHDCQILPQAEKDIPQDAQFNYDWICTPTGLINVSTAKKPNNGFDFEKTIPSYIVNTVVPLQELKGIKMMETIMSDGGFAQKDKRQEAPTLSADEQMGINMIERIMKGYKP